MPKQRKPPKPEHRYGLDDVEALDQGDANVSPKEYPLTYGTGRVSTLNEQIIKRIAMTVGHGLTIPVACAALGIPQGTWKSWSKRGREHRELNVESVFTQWLDALDQAKGAVEASWVAQLVAHGSSDPRCLMWLLERRFPARYVIEKQDKKPLGEGKDTAHKTTAELIAELGAMGAKLPPGLGVGALGSGLTSIEDDSNSDDSPGVLNLASTVTDSED